jgi:hypothetical protein
MKLPKVPSPEESLEKLTPLFPELYAGFESGIFEARDYFEVKHIATDLSVASMLIRLHVKDRLLKAGLKDVRLENHSLCGLDFLYKDMHVRIWKSDDHILPDPGRSRSRQSFYQYDLEFPDRAPYNKFVILWNLNDTGGVTLWLECPKNFDAETRVSEVHWFVPVPDPTKAIKAEPAPRTYQDLPIGRKDSAKKVSNKD